MWWCITPTAELSFGISLQREVALFHKEEIHSNSMQNRLPSWPPLLNQININTEAFNSISRQPEVVFNVHVVCCAGATPVFWKPNSISSLTKERFDFTGGKPQLEVSCQDRRPCFSSRRRERSHKCMHTQTHVHAHMRIHTSMHNTLSGYMHNTDSVTQLRNGHRTPHTVAHLHSVI